MRSTAPPPPDDQSPSPPGKSPFSGKGDGGPILVAESPGANKVDDGCGEVDFLTQMPDDVLCIILSFLRLEDAIYAKLLSHRWRHLFPPNPTLCFDDNEFRGNGNTFHTRLELVYEPEKFVAWVDTVMRQLRVPKIEAFELNKEVGGEHARIVDEWIRIACVLKAD